MNAIAPNAPIGASRMINATTSKSASDVIAMTSTSRATRAPSRSSARPKTTENSRTCRISPRANAPTTVSGMMLRMKSVVLRCCDADVYCETDATSAVAGSNPTPAPGCSTLTTTSPMVSAAVETTSKYTSARMPMRPTSFIAPMCAMPTTTVVKTIGAISIFTSLMKPSPSGFIAAARSGETRPKRMPSAMPTRTWK